MNTPEQDACGHYRLTGDQGGWRCSDCQLLLKMRDPDDYPYAAQEPSLKAPPSAEGDDAPAAASDTLGATLSATMDATVWAREFHQLHPAMDEGTMLAWFANAIMCGFDHAKGATSHEDILKQAVAICAIEAQLKPSNQWEAGYAAACVNLHKDISALLAARG
jgi:hypothetical protein